MASTADTKPLPNVIRTGSDDAATINDIYDRLERGEDTVTVECFRGLLRLREMNGKEVTMKDLRILLRVDEPKPTPKQIATTVVVVAGASWVLLSMVLGLGQDGYWAGFGVACFGLWMAYSIGVSAGSKFFPKGSKSANIFEL